MTCQRCSGLMVTHWIVDPREALAHPSEARVWRCVPCGNIEDRVILRHRAMQAAERASVQAAASEERELALLSPFTFEAFCRVHGLEVAPLDSPA